MGMSVHVLPCPAVADVPIADLGAPFCARGSASASTSRRASSSRSREVWRRGARGAPQRGRQTSRKLALLPQFLPRR